MFVAGGGGVVGVEHCECLLYEPVLLGDRTIIGVHKDEIARRLNLVFLHDIQRVHLYIFTYRAVC